MTQPVHLYHIAVTSRDLFFLELRFDQNEREFFDAS
jgi:hypothetical protein